VQEWVGGGGGRGQDRKEADLTHSLNSEPEDLFVKTKKNSQIFVVCDTFFSGTLLGQNTPILSGYFTVNNSDNIYEIYLSCVLPDHDTT
jgi:hypothetical protein